MIEREFSQSKLNLFLKVTARRPDGYHELETLFLPLPYPPPTAPEPNVRLPLAPTPVDTISGSSPNTIVRDRKSTRLNSSH